MRFDFNFYSSLLLVFFIHGLVYAAIVWRKGVIRGSRPEGWLALFLLLAQLIIFPWMVGFAGWYDNQPYRDILFYLPCQQLFLIGPVVYFYVQSLLNPGFSFQRKDFIHFLPAFLYGLFSLVVFLTDKVVLQRYYFLADGRDPDFDTWYQLAGYFSIFLYFGLSIRYYRFYRRMIVQVVSFADTLLFRWVNRFLLAVLLILLSRAVLYILDLVWGYGYADTWWYFLAFALIAYYIAITGYSNSVESRIAFRYNLLEEKKVFLLAGPHTPVEEVEEIEILEPGPGLSSSNNEPTRVWVERVKEAIENGKVYEDPELTLTQFARQLGTNPSFLSRVINQGLGLSFNDFINQYRVAAVKQRLDEKEHHRQTLLSIAYECGFNSKATFNRAFRKHTGKSPSDYARELS